MYDLDQNSQFKSGSLDDFGHLDTRKSCVSWPGGGLVVIVYGCIELAWDFCRAERRVPGAVCGGGLHRRL